MMSILKKLRTGILCFLTIFLVCACVQSDRESIQHYKDKRFAEAYSLLKREAESGLVDAQYFLATLYENGQGTEKNDKAAFYWNEKAAKKGFPEAENKLGD